MYVCCQSGEMCVPAFSFITKAKRRKMRRKMRRKGGRGFVKWDLSDEMFVQTLKI